MVLFVLKRRPSFSNHKLSGEVKTGVMRSSHNNSDKISPTFTLNACKITYFTPLPLLQ